MNSDCDKIRDGIEELVNGTLSEAETNAVRQHLRECSGCSQYAGALEEEEQRLASYFALFESNMSSMEDEVIDALERTEVSGREKVFSVGRDVIIPVVAKHALAAAVIVVVTVYFVITFTWISQINECIARSI